VGELAHEDDRPRALVAGELAGAEGDEVGLRDGLRGGGALRPAAGRRHDKGTDRLAQHGIRYADDDGAKYFELFRMVAGDADVELLTDFDADSARLFPGG